MNRDCEFVSDLLPLYAEGIASESTCRLVEEHIAGCDHCREALEKMKQNVPLPIQTDVGDLVRFKRNMYKKKILWGLLGLQIMITLFFAAWVVLSGLPGAGHIEILLAPNNWTIGYLFAGSIISGLLCLSLGGFLRKKRWSKALLGLGTVFLCCAASCLLVTGGSFGVPEVMVGQPLPVLAVRLQCIGILTLLSGGSVFCIGSLIVIRNNEKRKVQNEH